MYPLPGSRNPRESDDEPYPRDSEQRVGVCWCWRAEVSQTVRRVIDPDFFTSC